ncbi:Na+/H+ antiporter NhaC [Virgibacillus dakarensis]|uniref:Na+/H+ antiporter NhaC n=1 Tax=Virgibacillus dakarensis TaxID=1917889 RepID=UPI000B44D9AD|nr:Na+/H+ antiporter NhaC [Virgibacillus dakarensis]MBT2217971.1 Na+/H+ antiporter NhaC [Virgibacillus dakarensis]
MNKKREATFFESVLSLFFMFFFVFIGYLLFGLRVELMMVAAAACAGILAWRIGLTWTEMEKTISERIISATPAILIIWVIGIVIATFIFSGSIPMLIYYGIKIVNPEHLLISAFLLNIIFSIVTGTSWGSVGTVGVAMMSIAAGIGVPLHITAAAVICGAIFGDKLSPLSETTNLAAATSGVNLYDHIKSMLWTTIPASIITFLFFYIIGLNLEITENTSAASSTEMLAGLDQIFDWNILLILPFLVILLGAIFRKPPVPVMLLGSLLSLIIGVFYQGFTLESGITAAFSGFNVSMVPGMESANWSDALITLLNRGGVMSMVGVVIIIYCGYSYTAIISKAGFLETALRPLTNRVKKRGPLMITTLFTELFILVFSGTSYTVAIMIPEMFKKPFLKAGMGTKALSRSIEDVGTMMASLVPWGTSGAFYISTLGIPVFGANGYALWSVLTYSTPIIAIILAFAGIGIYKMNATEAQEALAQYEAQKNIS